MLSTHDFQRLIRSMQMLEKEVDLWDFPRHAIASTAALLSADMCSYGEVDTASLHAMSVSDNDTFISAELMASWAKHTLAPELLPYWETTKLLEVVRLSDIVGNHLERLPIYQEYFRPLDVRYQLAVPISHASGVVVSIGYNRALSDFTDTDRELLRQLAPSLSQAYKRARKSAAWQQRAVATSELEWRSTACIPLTPRGTLGAVPGYVRRWIADHFGAFPSYSSTLPDQLQAWLSFHLTLGNSIICESRPDARQIGGRRGDSRLEITLVGDREGGFRLFVEHVEPIPRAYIVELFKIGEREADVLKWLMRGKTNPEIGQILHISAGTVKTHVQNLFPKLGVGNRVAALTTVLERLHGGNCLIHDVAD